MSAAYCPRCGKPILVDEHGDRRCQNGHALADNAAIVEALTRLVPVMLEIREAIESLEVKVGTTEPTVSPVVQEVAPGDEWVELPEMAAKLRRSEDWLRDHARELGGRQRVKRGRWLFSPPLTMALFGAGTDERHDPPTRVVRPPALPQRVPLLPVRDEAA
jgi:hypothetical protein